MLTLVSDKKDLGKFYGKGDVMLRRNLIGEIVIVEEEAMFLNSLNLHQKKGEHISSLGIVQIISSKS